MKHCLVLTILACLLFATSAAAGSMNGRAGQMPALYDGQLFMINFKELPPGGEAATLAQNRSINTIYQSDQAVNSGFDFISVLDAIQGDGFNPLWQEVQIVFLGISPVFVQFQSDTDILAAASGPSPTIQFIPTTEVYRCSVLGPGPK